MFSKSMKRAILLSFMLLLDGGDPTFPSSSAASFSKFGLRLIGVAPAD
jgi:hypothetical protein